MKRVGSSIHACRSIKRNIAALEPDEDIFKALLVPLQRTAPTPTPPELEPGSIGDDIDGDDIVVERIVKKSRFRK